MGVSRGRESGSGSGIGRLGWSLVYGRGSVGSRIGNENETWSTSLTTEMWLCGARCRTYLSIGCLYLGTYS
jgi:hypothetical protein